MKRLRLLFMAALLAGCGLVDDGNRAAREVALEWADAYFNCDFHQAEEYITPEGGKWLRFAASNITEQQLQLLQQHEVKVEADMSDYVNDTMQVVTLKVNNYLAPTPLGEEPTIKEQGTFRITLVKRDNKWKVRMEGLPRNEKQSHD